MAHHETYKNGILSQFSEGSTTFYTNTWHDRLAIAPPQGFLDTLGIWDWALAISNNHTFNTDQSSYQFDKVMENVQRDLSQKPPKQTSTQKKLTGKTDNDRVKSGVTRLPFVYCTNMIFHWLASSPHPFKHQKPYLTQGWEVCLTWRSHGYALKWLWARKLYKKYM